jgi:hypothetical protein
MGFSAGVWGNDNPAPRIMQRNHACTKGNDAGGVKCIDEATRRGLFMARPTSPWKTRVSLTSKLFSVDG